jgi:hypothetical protein
MRATSRIRVHAMGMHASKGERKGSMPVRSQKLKAAHNQYIVRPN